MPDPSTRGRIGMRVREQIVRPDRGIVEKLAAFGSNLVADGMLRFGVMSSIVRCMKPGWKVAGPSITVRTRPADNLMVMRAIGIAQPGDVLVVSTMRHNGSAIWGELTTLAALKQGIAGLVTDGGMRDLPIVQELGLPVFAGGVTPSACDKDGPGEINFPIAVGDIPVMPGDIVIGDDDGVVVVPAADAEGVIAGIEAKSASEVRRRQEIASGKVVPDAVVAAVDQRL